MAPVATRTTILEAQRVVGDALDLISDERTWTRDAWARDRKGRKVEPGSERPKPVAWCLVGALWEAEHRFAVAAGEEPPNESAVVGQPSRRLALALAATCLAFEPSYLRDRGWTTESALAIELDRATSLRQLSAMNDLPFVRHRDVLAALTNAAQLLTDLEGQRNDGAVSKPGQRPAGENGSAHAP